MNNNFLLEICANGFASALAAQQAGADRIELCENLAEGGTTPSYGLLQHVRQKVRLPIHVLIRPRPGDFVYSDDEFAIMQTDIRLCKKLGYDGIVAGIMTDGYVDMDRMATIVQLAAPLPVTFHRAFDRCYDPFSALEAIIDIGCKRLLTSGQQPTAEAGKELIRELVQRAGDRLTIIPGAGIREHNIVDLATYTEAREFHTSAKQALPAPTEYHQPALPGMDSVREESNTVLIRRILAELSRIPVQPTTKNGQ